MKKFLAVEELVDGVKSRAVARHLRLAALTANAGLKPVRTKPAVQDGGSCCCTFLSLLLRTLQQARAERASYVQLTASASYQLLPC